MVYVLDFWDLLVNNLAGSTTMFLIVALVSILIISISKNLSDRATLILLLTFILVMIPFINTLAAVFIFVLAILLSMGYKRVLRP